MFWFLCQQRPAISPHIVSPAPVNEANATRDVIPTTKTVLCRPEKVDKLDEIVAGAPGVFGKWGSGLWVVKVVYVGF